MRRYKYFCSWATLIVAALIAGGISVGAGSPATNVAHWGSGPAISSNSSAISQQ